MPRIIVKRMRKAQNILVILILLASTVFILNAPFIPKAHAAGPSKVQTCLASQNSAQSVSCPFNLSIVAGDTIVVGFSGNFVGGGVTTVSGGGLSWTQQATKASGNPGAQVYSAPDPGGGALTVTAATTGTANFILIVAYEVSGIEATATNTATGACAFNCLTQTMTTSTSIGTSGTFAIADYFDGSGSGPNINPTTSFASVQNVDYNILDTNALYGAEWSTTSAGTTNFSMLPSGQGNVWVVAAATFGAAVTVTVVVPCTFFQLQCWMYPMFFTGTYLGFFIGLAAASEVSEKAFLYLMLSGTTFASLIEVDMGIMTAMIPVILVALNVAYSFNLAERLFNVVTRRGMGGGPTT